MNLGWYFRVGRLMVAGPAVMGLAALACGGQVGGPRAPGGSNSLVGSVAVEPDESHVWAAHSVTNSLGQVRTTLVAVDPAANSAMSVLDISDDSGSEMIFPAPHRAIYLAYAQASGEYAVLLDTSTLSQLLEVPIAGSLSNVRPSPSGSFAIAEDTSTPRTTERVLDSRTLLTGNVPGQSSAVTMVASWNHSSDRLIAAASPITSGGVPLPTTRLLRYSVSGSASGPSFGAPDIDVVAPGALATGECFGDPTCLRVSPDDRWAVVPVATTSGAASLVVLDETSGTFRTVPGHGPVGFTPDSSTIVAYEWSADGSTVALDMIDTATLAVHPVPLPTAETPSYFVTQDGSAVVVTPVLGDGQMTIYDTTTGSTTSLPSSSISLEFDEFVVRPGRHQLWIASGGDLFVLSLATPTPTLGQVPLTFAVGALNILPQADRLVLVPRYVDAVDFYSMATRQVVSSVSLTAL